MSNAKELTLAQFCDQLESTSPVPGGGAVAALGASLSASLICMVARLTLKNKKYQAKAERMKAILANSQRFKRGCLALVDKDIEAYNLVYRNYQLPKHDKKRSVAIERALKRAVAVPLNVVHLCDELVSLAREVAKIGNKNAYSDAKTALHFAKAAKLSAWENVRINLAGISDIKWKRKMGLSEI